MARIRINRAFVEALLGMRGMTLRDLADASGVGEATVYRMVNGAPFRSETLGKVAEALGCHPVDLIVGEGYASPHVGAPATATAGS
ncbi:MAG: hypothetical protein KatS3mg049_2056 [Caldilinea sp.]|nr:MAG: hypothetical protein KatS3mg049_2056 [Caldilinea sp.]